MMEINEKEINKAFENSYKLLMGETTYEELGSTGVFILPENHEDPYVTLKYYESIEDYEKCIKIRDIMNND
jgi:hypothetical protein